MSEYSKTLDLIKPYWKRVLLAALVSLIMSGLNAALAWLVKPAMDDILIKKNVSYLVLLPIAVLIVFVLRGGFNFLHEYLMRSSAQKMIMDLRNKLYEHIIALPASYFVQNSSGALMSRVMNDTNVLQSVLSLTVKDLFVESASVLALTGVALWRRWDLTLIALVALPAAFYAIGRLGKRLKQISRRSQEKISVITESLHESFTGVRLIKAFNREGEEIRRFSDKNKHFYREVMRSVRVSELASLIMEMVAGFGIAFVMWYGGKLVISSVMTPGDFFSFLTAIFMLYTPAKRLAKVSTGIQQARAALLRTFELLDETPEHDGNVELLPFSSGIRFDNVSFTYPGAEKKALDSLCLNVRKGEIVAVVGRSGGGKTTLINMLPRFFLPDEGGIYIDGHDITTLTARSLRAQFGMVSQDVILFNDTVAANIAYGLPTASRDDIRAAAEAAYAHEFIMGLPQGYDTIIGERGMSLSGGQRQRLSIARAILKDPAILVLDEATSSLDTDSERMIQNALDRLMRNRTTLVIAHRLSTIQKADRIVVLDRGRIIETGTHAELLAGGGIYRKLYEMQYSEQAAEDKSPGGRADY